MTTKRKKRPSKVELVRLDKLEALIADARLAEAESERARTAAVAEAAALRSKLRTAEVMERERSYEDGIVSCGACGMALGEGHTQKCRYHILEDPSPAVERLERRLAPMPCGHPGACADDAGHCGWCEDAEELAGANMALDILHRSLEVAEARAEALAALVPDLLRTIAFADDSLVLCGWFGMARIAREWRALAARIEDARGMEK